MRPGEEDDARRELEQPFPVAPKSDYIEKKLHRGLTTYQGEDFGANASVFVNDEARVGPAKAKVLTLLGINEKQIDDVWYHFVNTTSYQAVGRYDVGGNRFLWAKFHQEDMGWRFDLDIPDNVGSLDDLVYIDERPGTRWITFKCKRWHLPDGFNPSLASDPIPPGAWSEPEVLRHDPEELGVVSAAWFGVTEAQHDSTHVAWGEINSAWEHLKKALQEIELAGKIADKAWKGPRSEAAEFKFWLEYEMIESITQVTEYWGAYLAQLGRAQGDQIRAQKQLLWEVEKEIGIAIVMTAITWGLGAPFAAGRTLYRAASILSKADKSRKGAGKIKRFSRALKEARDFQRKKRSETAGETAKKLKWYQTLGGIAAAGAVDGAKDFGATRVVERGKTGEWTLDNWWKSFVFAGAIGGAGGKTAEAMRGFFKKHHIDMGDATYGFTREGAKGLATAGSKEALTNDPLVGGVLTAPLAGAAKDKATAAIKAGLIADGVPEETAEKIATKAAELPINAAKAATAKGIDEHRKQQGETSDLPPPGNGIISKPRVTR
jgi:hypothetical protein